MSSLKYENCFLNISAPRSGSKLLKTGAYAPPIKDADANLSEVVTLRWK